MGWWGDNMPTWLGGNTPPPPPPQSRAQLRAAQTRTQQAQNDAQRRLSPHPTAQTGCLPCQAPQVRPPCDLRMFEVVEHRTRPNAAVSRAQGGPARVDASQDDDDEIRTHPKTFPFESTNVRPHPGPPYRSGQILEFVGQDKRRGITCDAVVRFESDVHCGQHPVMEVIDPWGQKTDHRVTQKRFELEYPELSVLRLHRPGTNWTNINNYWPWGMTPIDWVVTAKVCGVRPRQGVFGLTQVKLRVWPGHQFEFKLTIRPRWRGHGSESRMRETYAYADGRRTRPQGVERVTRTSTRGSESNRDFLGRDRNREETSRTTEESHLQRTSALTGTTNRTATRTTNSDTYRGRSADGRETTERTRSSSGVGGRMDRLSEETSITQREGVGQRRTLSESTSINGNNMEHSFRDERSGIVYVLKQGGQVLASPFRGLDAILQAIATVESAWARIQAWFEAGRPQVSVQVGWKLDFSFSLFAGEISSKWGWKEYSDHRAFFAYKIELALKIFSAEFDVNYGIGVTASCWAGTFEFSAAIGINGSAEFSIVGELKRLGPDRNQIIGAGVKAKAAGEISVYIRAIALSEKWCKAEARLKLPLEAEGEPKVDSGGFGIECGVKLKPLVASLNFTVRGLLNFTREREVMAQRELMAKRLVRLV